MAAVVDTPRSFRGERWRLRVRSARTFVHQFSRKPAGVVGVIVLAFFSILAIAPGLFVGPLQTVTTATGAHVQAPTLHEILGTDSLGRSVLNLTVWGTRVSMIIGLLATIVTVVVGALVGIVSGYFGGLIDGLLMRITDLFLVLPTFVLALILAPIILEIVGSDAEIVGIRITLIVIVVVIGLTSWASTARVARSRSYRSRNVRSWTGPG
jgi:peptide/nickel transport system permease protein